MYSWAMLFVTITSIYGYRLYNNQFNIKNLILFGIFSFLSACIHYYGTMAAGLINLTLFIFLLKNLKEKKRKSFEIYNLCFNSVNYIYTMAIFFYKTNYTNE